MQQGASLIHAISFAAWYSPGPSFINLGLAVVIHQDKLSLQPAVASYTLASFPSLIPFFLPF